MTIKYESEILFDLMKRDGDDTPSDVLPYESELKEKYINQVVGAYPKLQDYRPEWLNYNLYHHLPSDFPTESVANVTSASFQNVVPYAYQSAILKGQTLVNVNRSNFTTKSNITTDYANSISLFDVDMKANTTYTIIAYSDNLYNYRLSEMRDEKEVGLDIRTVGTPFVYTTDTAFTGLRGYLKGDTLNIPKGTEIKILIVEGDHSNEDILYFEGVQSVKIPVLTTSNEDGTKTNILTVNEDVTLRGIGDVQDTLDCLTGEVVERVGEIVLDGSENWTANFSTDTTILYSVFLININKNAGVDSIICDRFITENTYNNNTDKESIFGSVSNQSVIYIRISKNKLVSEDNNGIKTWLSQNPITIQYQLETESVKTVDLSCVNEQGDNETFRPIEGTMHVNTSSQTLPPLLDMSVPVEATSQNLMSFANIVEEEK